MRTLISNVMYLSPRYVGGFGLATIAQKKAQLEANAKAAAAAAEQKRTADAVTAALEQTKREATTVADAAKTLAANNAIIAAANTASTPATASTAASLAASASTPDTSYAFLNKVPGTFTTTVSDAASPAPKPISKLPYILGGVAVLGVAYYFYSKRK